jgi:hypothetical protein
MRALHCLRACNSQKYACVHVNYYSYIVMLCAHLHTGNECTTARVGGSENEVLFSWSNMLADWSAHAHHGLSRSIHNRLRIYSQPVHLTIKTVAEELQPVHLSNSLYNFHRLFPLVWDINRPTQLCLHHLRLLSSSSAETKGTVCTFLSICFCIQKKSYPFVFF